MAPSSICGRSFEDRAELWGKMPDDVLEAIALLGSDATPARLALGRARSSSGRSRAGAGSCVLPALLPVPGGLLVGGFGIFRSRSASRPRGGSLALPSPTVELASPLLSGRRCGTASLPGPSTGGVVGGRSGLEHSSSPAATVDARGPSPRRSRIRRRSSLLSVRRAPDGRGRRRAVGRAAGSPRGARRAEPRSRPRARVYGAAGQAG
jgi:hypothetical protein